MSAALMVSVRKRTVPTAGGTTGDLTANEATASTTVAVTGKPEGVSSVTLHVFGVRTSFSMLSRWIPPEGNRGTSDPGATAPAGPPLRVQPKRLFLLKLGSRLPR